MRRCTSTVALLLLVALAACSANPTNRWAQGRAALTTAQNTVLILHQAGIVSDENLVAADPAVQAGRAALDKAETYLPGGGLTYEHYMGLLDAVLARLEQLALSGHLGGD